MTSIPRTPCANPAASSLLERLRRVCSSVIAPGRRLRAALSAAIARFQSGRIDEIEIGRGTGARI